MKVNELLISKQYEYATADLPNQSKSNEPKEQEEDEEEISRNNLGIVLRTYYSPEIHID